MKLYKLTDKAGNTKCNTRWDVGVVHRRNKCKNPRLCSSDIFHAYTNINLAFLLNPIHAEINNPVVWECEGTPVVDDWGKVGCFRLKVIQKLDDPIWINSDKEKHVQVTFAVLCAESVLHYHEEKYLYDNRPRAAIDVARIYLVNPHMNASTHYTSAVYDAASAAYAAHAAAHAVYDAHAAAHAAHAAAHAAHAASAAVHAVHGAAHAAHAAAHAAHAAAHAASAADTACAKIDFGILADKAVEMVYNKEKNENSK